MGVVIIVDDACKNPEEFIIAQLHGMAHMTHEVQGEEFNSLIKEIEYRYSIDLSDNRFYLSDELKAEFFQDRYQKFLRLCQSLSFMEYAGLQDASMKFISVCANLENVDGNFVLNNGELQTMDTFIRFNSGEKDIVKVFVYE